MDCIKRIVLKEQKFILFICFIFIASIVNAQTSEPVDVKPVDLLMKAARAWDRLDDYQALVHQIEAQPNGTQKELWALVTLIKEDNTPQHSKPRPDIKKGRDSLSLFRLDFFEQQVLWEQVAEGIVQGVTPTTIYFSNSMERLYTYKPKQNSLTIDPLDENAPIKEFLYLAGFAEYNINAFFEEVYLGQEVYQETIEGMPTYRVKMIFKKDVQEVVPPRFVWLDQKSLLPKRFSVESDVAIHFEFIDWKIDQDLNYTRLIPEVPADVFVVDHTKSQAQK